MLTDLVDASTLTDSQRADLGIKERIPKTLAESLVALESNKEMQSLLGSIFVGNFVTVKRAELERLLAMPEEDRRVWLLEKF